MCHLPAIKLPMIHSVMTAAERISNRFLSSGFSSFSGIFLRPMKITSKTIVSMMMRMVEMIDQITAGSIKVAFSLITP